MGLNKEQQAAVDSNERTILCLAAAGSGKTKTLICRTVRLVNDGVDPNSILCLTFTNAAAFEMKERYKIAEDADLSKCVPEFRTFHSFCYSLIIKDQMVRERLGYTQIPQLCDDDQMKELKARVKLQIGCKLSDAQLENDCSLSRAEQDEKNLFLKAVKKQLKKENLITFDMMCYNVCELFVRDEPCVFTYKQKYKYIMCDEFQDVDPKQFKFMSSFPDTTNFFFVGDCLQNIYAFRGTSNEYIKQLTVTPGWNVIKLYENYRSTNQICEFANKFSTYASDEYRIAMHGQRDGDPVEVIRGSFTSYNEPVDEVHLKKLTERVKSNPGECAILCRTNKECSTIKSTFKDDGIDFSASNKSTDSLDILKSSLDNQYMLEWLSSKLETKDYGDYIRLSAIEPNPDIRWFLSLYGNRTAIHDKAQKVSEIRKIVSDNTVDTKTKFEAVAKVVRAKTKCTFDPEKVKTNRQIVEEICNQLTEMAENKVYIGTIHSSKGLEYDTVYVMGVDDGMFKLGTEEMNNLAYVAFTRAREKLVVFRR